MRKLARTLQDDIFIISKKFQIQGNLYGKMKRINPTFIISKLESYWLSHF